MVKIENITILHPTQVTVLLDDIYDTMIRKEDPLLSHLRLMFSNAQSLSHNTEEMLRRIQQVNMYSMDNGIEGMQRRKSHGETGMMSNVMSTVISNVYSKYLDMIERGRLKQRNSKLVKEMDTDEKEFDEKNLMENELLKHLERVLDFDSNTILGVMNGIEIVNHQNETFLKLLLSSTVKSCFSRFMTMSKRHQRLDKLNYIRISIYFVYTPQERILEDCLNSKLEMEHLTRKNDYPLKVVLVVGKNSMEWTRDGFVLVDDMNYNSNIETNTCLKKRIAVCKTSDSIHQYLNKLVEFNCKWNASMFYNSTTCNTGHHVKCLLTFMNISNINREAQVILDCICENKPIPLQFNLPTDLLYFQTFQNNLTQFLKSYEHEPRWITPIVASISNESFDEYVEMRIESDWNEIYSFYTFFLPYLNKCKAFSVSNELRMFLVAVLESNHQVMRGEWYETLLQFVNTQMNDSTRRMDMSYHAPVYNFSGYTNFVNLIKEGDARTLTQISSCLNGKECN